MPTLNYSTIYFSIAPRSYASQTSTNGGNTYDVYGGPTGCFLRSVNSDIILQLYWTDSGMYQYEEGTGSSGQRVTGDLVNVLFDIYEGTSKTDSSYSLANDFNLLCTIRKQKDVATRWSGRPQDEPALQGHRFTINISQILADLLSYSLIPVNTGTWGGINDGNTGPTASTNSSPNLYGGMNGQWKLENIATLTSIDAQYNRTANGADRRIAIRARFEILASDGSLEMATSPSNRQVSDFYIVNSAPQWGDNHNLDSFVVSRWGSSFGSPFKLLTNCPNDDTYSAEFAGGNFDNIYFKKIRLDDEAEFISWFQRLLPYTTSPTTDTCTEFSIKVETSATRDFAVIAHTVSMVDCTMDDRARESGGAGTERFYRAQNRQFAQNVSPAFINQHNNGPDGDYWTPGYTVNPISLTNKFYRLHVTTMDTAAVEIRQTQSYYYEIDTESKGSWGDVCGMKEGVKFAWLNRMGGIDTYTAKRNFTNSIEVSQGTITKKKPYRAFPIDAVESGDPASSGIGANMYPHSREVLNVDANRNYTVFTDPLIQVEAKWLEELLTSPNVWVIQENAGSEYLQALINTEEVRPSSKGYMPVLITNSETSLIDEENGLVQIQIEFSESHEINTQRN